MCGIPQHALESYLARLVAAGKKVAISEQTEAPSKGRALVPRRIVRIVTPGTIVDPERLDARRPNEMAAVTWNGDGAAVSTLDLSTGDFAVVKLLERAALAEWLLRRLPRELVFFPSDRPLAESLVAALVSSGAEAPALSPLKDDSSLGARRRSEGHVVLPARQDGHVVRRANASPARRAAARPARRDRGAARRRRRVAGGRGAPREPRLGLSRDSRPAAPPRAPRGRCRIAARRRRARERARARGAPRRRPRGGARRASRAGRGGVAGRRAVRPWGVDRVARRARAAPKRAGRRDLPRRRGRRRGRGAHSASRVRVDSRARRGRGARAPRHPDAAREVQPGVRSRLRGAGLGPRAHSRGRPQAADARERRTLRDARARRG